MIKKIAKEIKEEVLAKAKAGEKVSVLADQYGISDRTIYAWLRQNTGTIHLGGVLLLTPR